MLGPLPDISRQLSEANVRIGIIPRGSQPLDMPEFRNLPQQFPQEDWNARRALTYLPLASMPEEDLVSLDPTDFDRECVGVHEVAHMVMDGVLRKNEAFMTQLEAAYELSKSNPNRIGTYSAKNIEEYWAEGTQEYFDASRFSFTGGPKQEDNGPIATREDLKRYDPELHILILSVWGDNPWRPAGAPDCVAA